MHDDVPPLGKLVVTPTAEEILQAADMPLSEVLSFHGEHFRHEGYTAWTGIERRLRYGSAASVLPVNGSTLYVFTNAERSLTTVSVI
jgi:hypothetical protein